MTLSPRGIAALAGSLLMITACSGSTSSSSGPTASGPKASSWPPLPTEYVSGRPATQADVAAGRALFAAQVENGPPAQPSLVSVPQYAYCEDKGRRFRAIVVQAEVTQGMELLGVRNVDAGGGLVTLASSCQLLGQHPQ
jgi:hypothetical protein